MPPRGARRHPSRSDALLELLQSVSRQIVAMTATALARQEDRGVGRVGLPEYRILVLLHSVAYRRPSELASDLGVSRSAVAQLLGRLERRQLIARRVDPSDRRGTLLSLAPKGTRVVEAVLAEREGRLRPALAGLDASERSSFAVALGRLDAALRMRREPERSPG